MKKPSIAAQVRSGLIISFWLVTGIAALIVLALGTALLFLKPHGLANPLAYGAVIGPLILVYLKAKVWVPEFRAWIFRAAAIGIPIQFFTGHYSWPRVAHSSAALLCVLAVGFLLQSISKRNLNDRGVRLCLTFFAFLSVTTFCSPSFIILGMLAIAAFGALLLARCLQQRGGAAIEPEPAAINLGANDRRHHEMEPGHRADQRL